MAEIFEKVSFDPYNFRITIYRLNTKIRSTMLCLSGFELYSRWVPLTRGPKLGDSVCSCSLSVQEDLAGEQALIRFLV